MSDQPDYMSLVREASNDAIDGLQEKFCDKHGIDTHDMCLLIGSIEYHLHNVYKAQYSSAKGRRAVYYREYDPANYCPAHYELD